MREHFRDRGKARATRVTVVLLAGSVAALGQAPSETDLARRLDEVTGRLLGASYTVSPLGEGIDPDPDPRFRLDAFDCTTFVETGMALALTSTEAGARSLLDLIRYRDGEPRFATRRHLIASQWIPGLIADGFLEEMTEEIGGTDTRWAKLVLDAKSWRRSRLAWQLPLSAEDVPSGAFRLPYVPLERVEQRVERLEAGVVLNVVRPATRRSPLLVTHQALVVAVGHDTALVRHASSARRRVVEERIEALIHRFRRAARRPVLGFNFLRIRSRSDLDAAQPNP